MNKDFEENQELLGHNRAITLKRIDSLISLVGANCININGSLIQIMTEINQIANNYNFISGMAMGQNSRLKMLERGPVCDFEKN